MALHVLLATAFLGLTGLAVAFDLYLVLVRKTKSISLRTWIATKAHPTLIAAGILLSVVIAFLVQDYPALVYFTGLLAGHLFVHW